VRLRKVRQGYELFLEWIMIVLMIALAVEVTAGVVFRYSGHSLVWYDEVATILLAWVTFYGSALAVLKHGHMGVPEIVRMMPRGPRVAVTLFAQVATLAFYVVLAWVGVSILEILASDTLVSLPWVSVAVANSVIPISAVLIIIAQVLVFPEVLDEARRGDVTKAEELI
jgi:TRAP-type C4-dicarboxylate transport system permease small subunit